MESLLGDAVTLYGSPPIVDNKISYCPPHDDGSGGRTVPGGGLDQAGRCAISVTCVVSVEGDIPVSPTFELNGTAYTAQGIKNNSLAEVDDNSTHYTLLFPCAPLTYRCYLVGGSSSSAVTVEASECIAVVVGRGVLVFIPLS